MLFGPRSRVAALHGEGLCLCAQGVGSRVPGCFLKENTKYQKLELRQVDSVETGLRFSWFFAGGVERGLLCKKADSRRWVLGSHF